MNPLITIAMPVYNVEKYVRRALISALNQTYDNIEILVIDDKGSDNSMDIVREIQVTHPRGEIIRIIDHIVNQGTGATKNTSINESRGDYLLFMDSDDYLANKSIDLMYNAVKMTDADLAVGSFEEFSVNSDVRIRHRNAQTIFDGEDAYAKYYNSKEYYVQTWNKLYRVDMLRKNSIYCIPSNTHEDIYFSFQLFPIIRRIVTIPDITYYYAVGDENSVTYNMRKNNIDNKRIVQFLGILESMDRFIHEKGYDKNQAGYLLLTEALLIKDICYAANISTSQKRNYLSKIPKYERKYSQAISILQNQYIRYFSDDPIIEVRKEKIKQFPSRVLNYLNRLLTK